MPPRHLPRRLCIILSENPLAVSGERVPRDEVISGAARVVRVAEEVFGNQSGNIDFRYFIFLFHIGRRNLPHAENEDPRRGRA